MITTTPNATPEVATLRSTHCRTRRLDLSHSAVSRIWRVFGVHPVDVISAVKEAQQACFEGA